MKPRRVASVISAGLIILSLLLSATPVAAWGGHGHHGDGRAVVRLEGLSSPKALAVKHWFDVYVGQGWAGPPGPVLKYGTLFHRGVREVTDDLSLTDIAFARDGATWLLGSDQVLYRQRHHGAEPEPVLNLADYQAGDPDPYDADPNDEEGPATETNPNGLAAVGKRSVLVVDAANNDLIRVKPYGTPVTVARWTLSDQSTEHLGPGFPPTLPAEAVPTTVAIGPDGWAYVGQLVGFPGTPGAAKIWRVNPWAEDAICSLDPDVAKDCSVWKSGFTAIFDIAFNRLTGTLYVYEIAEEGWLAFEEGFPIGPFPPAVLLEVKRHSVRELVRGELSQPGGVVVTPFGRVFVTDGMFTGGRLVEIKR